MRKIIAAISLSVLIMSGTAYGVHAYDTRNADSATVTNYNDGFITGTCAASPTVAHDSYNFTCEEWN